MDNLNARPLESLVTTSDINENGNGNKESSDSINFTDSSVHMCILLGLCEL